MISHPRNDCHAGSIRQALLHAPSLQCVIALIDALHIEASDGDSRFLPLGNVVFLDTLLKLEIIRLSSVTATSVWGFC
jgi:hypothetical protein